MTKSDAHPWLRQYPSGIGPDAVPRFDHMQTLWDAAVGADPDARCVQYFEESLSYRRIDEESDALASGLRDAGLLAGERVGIMLQNDPQWLVALLATWKAGAIAVSLSPMLKPRELEFQLRDSQIAVIVCLDSLYVSCVREALPGSSVRRVITTNPTEWLACIPPSLAGLSVESQAAGTESMRTIVDDWLGQELMPELRNPDSVAVLTYTSGTTGPPKGAMLTHRGIAYNSDSSCRWFALGPDDPVLGIAPLFHVTGLVLHMGISWAAASSLILVHRFDPEQVLSAIERWRPAFTIAATTAFTALLAHDGAATRDFSSLRVVASGGAPVLVAVVNQFREATGITIVSVYGLTETTSPSHLTPLGSSPPVDAESGALAVGLPIPGLMSEIVDVDTGAPLPQGRLGEIVISGPTVVPGYWGRPEESAAAIPGGRLFTGDVGFMTEDGWFFVVDRKKDLIVASGYKVWPREVEEVLVEHPEVVEAAVVGEPDQYRGETVVAWVVRAPVSTLTSEELTAFCRERLAAYKYPRSIIFVDELPKTDSGKILRRQMRSVRPS